MKECAYEDFAIVPQETAKKGKKTAEIPIAEEAAVENKKKDKKKKKTLSM